MTIATETLQDQFLNEVRKEHTVTTIFLMNGFQLKGVITGYDSFVVTVLSEGKQQMIYKHAISTIVPFLPVRIAPQG
ncbi:MAG: RNA chaperone Hfq [Clostridia bacterium]|nr:RNA chaperone Hfq [Clostridia bacterium]